MEGFWQGVGSFIDTYGLPLKILLILVVAGVAISVVSVVIRKAVGHAVRQAERRGGVLFPGMKPDERAVQRARTAGTMSTNIAAWLIVVIALTLVLGVVGVDLTGILASAGVLAAVLAFGAQNIIKDLLAGIFMVFEDQLGIGDVVDTGTVVGVVEAVGIRVTQVRDVTGALWFVRNGEITAISNGSRVWRRVIVDLVFVPDTPIDLARETVLGAMRTTAEDASVAPKILEDPASWEIQSFDGGSVAMRFAVQVRADAYDDLGRAFRASVRAAVRSAGLRLVDGQEPPWWHAVAGMEKSS